MYLCVYWLQNHRHRTLAFILSFWMFLLENSCGKT
jgi:hypothetical protein